METIKGERTEGASFWDACAKTSDRENAELENYHNILTLASSTSWLCCPFEVFVGSVLPHMLSNKQDADPKSDDEQNSQ